MSRLIASSDVTFALGYTPVNQAAMMGYVLASSLATVATTGSYGDLLNRPAAYALPIGSATILGGFKVGTGLTVATDGTLSATGGGGGGTSGYVLPVASASILGGVKQGVNISIATDGTISATGSAASPATAAPPANGTAAVGTSLLYARQDHVHPATIASATALGVIKVGTGLAVATDGTLSAPGAGGTSTYTLPIGSSTVLGGFKVGNGLAVATDGTLSTAGTGGTAYTLPAATPAVLGGIKVGANLTAASDGTLSAAAPPAPATVAPLGAGTAAVGTSALYARQDHVHPTDATRYAASNPSGYQTAAQVTAAIGAQRNPPRVITAAGNVTVAAADYYIGLNKTTGAATTVTFEANAVAGSTHVVKDIKGDADTNPITIVAGLKSDGTSGAIEGASSFLHNYPGSAFTFYHNGLEWSIV